MFATQFLRNMKMNFRFNLGGGGRGDLEIFRRRRRRGTTTTITTTTITTITTMANQPVEAVYQTKNKSDETLSCQPLLRQSV